MAIRRRHLLAATPLLLPAVHAWAQAANWPSKPIRIIVPTPPGGAYDRTMRPIAQEMAAQLKQPVIVENRPGAGNIIGTQAGATAPADGYTLTMTGMVNAIAQGLYDKVPFDIVTDFAHVGGIGGGAQWLVVHSGAGISSFADLVAQARREPGRLNYATSGQGSTGHLVMEQLQRSTGIQLTHVPYKGGAPALQDVLAGVVPITVVPIAGVLPHVKAGKVVPLAVSSEARTPEHPQVPTFAELGYPQLTAMAWVGLSAPRGTPDAVVQKIHAALRAAMDKPVLLAQLQADGMTPMPLSPERYAALVRSDTERWGALVRSLNLKAN